MAGGAITLTRIDRGLRLGAVPADAFYEYRLRQVFDGYKWDHQVGGAQNTITDKVLLLDAANYEYLTRAAEALARETVAMEAALLRDEALLLELGLSPMLARGLAECSYEPARHLRLMRFDFHPTTRGWRVSEVNSDVPAGFQEASLHPKFASAYFDGYEPAGDFGAAFAAAAARVMRPAGVAGLVYDSHTVEDAQMMAFLADTLAQHGYGAKHFEPDQTPWLGRELAGCDLLIRHYPAEWLEYLPNAELAGYLNSETPSCNHPQAVIAQSKRLPLVWDKLGVPHPMWDKLLPRTTAVVVPGQKLGKNAREAGYIHKPAFGRVGEGIDVPGAVTPREARLIAATAQQAPGQWVRQKLFRSRPVGGLHLAVGVFVLDGAYAGMFARASRTPRMDFDASELPVLKSADA